MKKILLIGKTGQLGSALLGKIAPFGFDVFAPSHEELDILREKDVEEAIDGYKPDVLINTAAFVKVPQCEDAPLEAFALNAVAVGNLARLSRARNVKFITFSTCYVFDGESAEPYREESSPNPLQTYGISKLAGEKAALNFYPEGAFVIRTGALYGGQTGSTSKGNFVLDVLKEVEGKDVIERSLEQFINPTFAEDIAQATLELIKKNAKAGIYHLVNEGYASWDAIARETLRICGIKCEVRGIDRGGKSGDMRRPKFAVLSNTRAAGYGIRLPLWQNGLSMYLKSINRI